MKLSPAGTTTAQANRENLAGLVERVTFHNEDSGFCVLRVKARGQRDLITVVGHAAAIGAGEFVQASGRWINDRTHGVQFRADFLRAAPPTTAEGIEKYLASGMIKGIGPIYAKKLVKAFREQVFDLIEQTPARLKEVDGIGPKRAYSIVAAWADQKAIREIMIFLHSHGVDPAVVIPLTTQHYPMLQRNLLYTAVTRGKRLVVIVGQKKAMAIAVKGRQTRRRWSKLREWLASAV